MGPEFYNNGATQTISRYLREKTYDRVADAMMLYVNPGSPAEQGLRNRRKEEGKLWNSYTK